MFGAIFQPPVAVWARHGQTDGAVRYRIRDFQRQWKSCGCRGNTVRHHLNATLTCARASNLLYCPHGRCAFTYRSQTWTP
jgi:hypothetical protein